MITTQCVKLSIVTQPKWIYTILAYWICVVALRKVECLLKPLKLKTTHLLSTSSLHFLAGWKFAALEKLRYISQQMVQHSHWVPPTPGTPPIASNSPNFSDAIQCSCTIVMCGCLQLAKTEFSKKFTWFQVSQHINQPVSNPVPITKNHFLL